METIYMDIEHFFSGDSTFDHKYCMIELPYIIWPYRKAGNFFPNCTLIVPFWHGKCLSMCQSVLSPCGIEWPGDEATVIL